MPNPWDAQYGSLPSVLSYGARGDGVTDDQSSIQAALTANANSSLFFPPGNYLHSSTLSGSSIRIYGWQKQSKLTATSNSSALYLYGSSVTLTGMRIDGNNTSRLSTDNGFCVVLNSVSSFEISYNLIEKGASGGIKMNTCTGGWVHHNWVQNTFADGIHHVKGTNNVLTEENDVYGTGDDCISVVSYSSDAVCSSIIVQNNRVGYNTWARGITCIGGTNITFRNNNITNAPHSGIHIAVEATSSYSTWACGGVNVLQNYLYNCGDQSRGLGAIHMYTTGGSSGQAVSSLVITGNHIELPRGSYYSIFSTGNYTILATVSSNTGRTAGTFYSSGNTASSTVITTSNNSSWSV